MSGKRNNCRRCRYGVGGEPDPCSDLCDACMCDPDTGWGGFYDHRTGKHFNSEDEQAAYYGGR